MQLNPHQPALVAGEIDLTRMTHKIAKERRGEMRKKYSRSRMAHNQNYRREPQAQVLS